MAPSAAPSLSDYQTAASSIYEPQKAADITTAQNTASTTVANQEALKGQVQTDYTTAIDNLSATMKSDVAKINQLYTERLGGNFSGLQGNDVGGIYAKGLQTQGTIESTRANKLSAIATNETNAQDTLASTIASLTSKYQGTEAQYANTAYTAAVKQYNTDQLNAEKIAQAQERIDISANKASTSSASAAAKAATAAADKYKVKQLTSGNKAYTGPNGQTNLYQYAAGVAGGDASQTYDIIKQELSTGSQTDQGAYNGMLRLEKQGLSQTQILQSLAKSNAYIFQ